MLEDYMKARRIGLRTYHRALSDGRYPYLHALDDMAKTSELSEFPVGLVEIPIDMIAGTRTKGRQDAFARDFMPLLDPHTEFARKWSALYDSQVEEGIRDPIRVYEYMHRFYVQEGNKRVSVSRFVGAASVMGDVTRLMPKASDDNDYLVYMEFLKFYEVAPIYELVFTQPGSYQKLAEILGQDLVHPWPIELLERLKGGYQAFEKVYREKAEGRVSIGTGDAFLTYLTFYGLEDLRGISEHLLGRRLNKLWSELIVQNDEDSIDLVKAPPREDGQSQGIIRQFLSGGPQYSLEHPLRAAFCYERPAENSSWIYGHELGRNEVEDYFHGTVVTEKFDDCADAESLRRNIDTAVANGDEIIFTISPKLMEETLRSALHYPKVRFLNCSVNMSHNAVRTYYGRMFEAKALMGALAASLTKEHRIGFIADYPIYGTLAEINAFAIGAAMMDPYVKVVLHWGCVKGSGWRETMQRNGVSVVSGHDFIRPDAASREYGLFMLQEDGSVRNLAVPVWNWGRFYELILRSVLNGTYDTDVPKNRALNYWWGMSAGVIDVILSDRLPYYSHKLVRTLKKAMIREAVGPFMGELRSQQGIVKAADAPDLSGDEIITMDWLNDNIEGRLPTMDELTDDARETVRVSGIIQERNRIVT